MDQTMDYLQSFCSIAWIDCCKAGGGSNGLSRSRMQFFKQSQTPPADAHYLVWNGKKERKTYIVPSGIWIET